MAQTVDDFETSLVPFARAPDTILTSALDANDSALGHALKNNVKQGPSASPTDSTSSTNAAFRADGSLLDWHVLAIASLASKLTYDRFGRTIRLQNVVENIYCLTTVGHGASFTVKAHDANKFSSEDKLRLDDLGVSGIVIKRLRHQSSSTSDDANRLAAILFELRVLTHKPLHEHQNIVTFVGLLWEGDPLGRNLLWPILIMERAEYGSLSQFQQRRFTLRYQTKRHLCADVAAGLDALHACGIVHGDVKNENILIFRHREKGFIAKVADFGCAVLDQHELDERTAGLGGTPPWNAPEFRNSKLTRASMKATDVYSYGFVVWRIMIDGRDPFESFEFGNTGKLATIETWKEQDELIEKAIWSLVSQPESDVQAEEVCSIFEATLQTSPSRRDLKLVLQIFDREA
jgi:serine/threonine protein kinase